jgi:hypothetical protein
LVGFDIFHVGIIPIDLQGLLDGHIPRKLYLLDAQPLKPPKGGNSPSRSKILGGLSTNCMLVFNQELSRHIGGFMGLGSLVVPILSRNSYRKS